MLPETPFLLLDRARMTANATRMLTRLNAAGVGFRPHVKTHKCVEVAHAMLGTSAGLDSAEGLGPITVSTLKEAEQFASVGFTDILYAVGIAPNKLVHAAKLIRGGVALKLLTDNVAAATALSAFARSENLSMPTIIEIDVDAHRSGVKPKDAATLASIARALGQNFAGVMTHAGDSYNQRSEQALQAMAEQERRGVVAAAAHLEAAGFKSNIVSVGSTPTALFATSYEGITEVRAGVYIFQDLVMAGLGVCALEDIAMSVVATVIGHRADTGWLITDAGWMAMSRDRGTAKQPIDQGYGLVCNELGQALTDLTVTDANQEHGIVASRSGNALTPQEFPVGTLLRILPNHACATAAQFDEYYLLNNERKNVLSVNGTWQRFRGW